MSCCFIELYLDNLRDLLYAMEHTRGNPPKLEIHMDSNKMVVVKNVVTKVGGWVGGWVGGFKLSDGGPRGAARGWLSPHVRVLGAFCPSIFGSYNRVEILNEIPPGYGIWPPIPCKGESRRISLYRGGMVHVEQSRS